MVSVYLKEARNECPFGLLLLNKGSSHSRTPSGRSVISAFVAATVIGLGIPGDEPGHLWGH